LDKSFCSLGSAARLNNATGVLVLPFLINIQSHFLIAGDFALVKPGEKHQYRNKGDQPFKMICGVPKEFE
jgi:hypothetical protein